MFQRYKVGQIINIGYYGGFQHQTKLKTQAEVVSVDGRFITIKIRLSHGATKTMFGYESELDRLVSNFEKF